jgi:hypothetical protein
VRRGDGACASEGSDAEFLPYLKTKVDHQMKV